MRGPLWGPPRDRVRPRRPASRRLRLGLTPTRRASAGECFVPAFVPAGAAAHPAPAHTLPCAPGAVCALRAHTHPHRHVLPHARPRNAVTHIGAHSPGDRRVRLERAGLYPCNTHKSVQHDQKKKKKTHSLHTLLIPRCTYNTGAHRLAYYLDSVYRQTEPWASRPTHTHMNTKARTSQRTHSQKQTEDLNHKLTSMLLERSCSCSQHMHTPMGQGLRLVKIMPNGVISQF